MSQGSDPAACEVAGTASTPRQPRATAATAATSLQAWRKRLTALIGEHPSCASVRFSRQRCLMSRMFLTSLHVNTQSLAHLHRSSRTSDIVDNLCIMRRFKSAWHRGLRVSPDGMYLGTPDM